MRLAIVVLFVTLIVLSGCARIELEDANFCSEDTDCVIVSQGPCSEPTSVNSQFEDRWKRKIARTYRNFAGDCIYTGPTFDEFKAQCVNNVCNAVLPSPSESQFTVGAGDYDLSLTHDGRERRYLVYVPQTYNKEETPVILAFHGGGGDPESIVKQSQFNDLSEKEGFIVVYPQGVGKKVLGKHSGTWNAGKCCGTAEEENVDDVGFVRAIIEKLSSDFNIDQNRIFATGHSNGAQFSYRLACDASDIIAAIGPNSGMGSYYSCSPQRSVPVIHFHGTEDPIAFYEGGMCGGKRTGEGWECKPVPDYIEEWRERNGCSDSTRISYQQGDTTCISYEGCSADVTLCTQEGAGHTWAGGEYALDAKFWKNTVGILSTDISASEEMWEFFEAHPRS